MTFFLANFFMLWVFWRPQEWLIRWLYGWPILDLVVAAAVLSLLVEVDGGSVRFPRRAPQLYLIPGMWVSAMMSHAAHTYFAGMMSSMVPVFKFVFFCFLLFCVIDRPTRLRAVARTFVVTTCIMAVHALLQTYRGYGFGRLRPMYTWTYQGPNIRTWFFGIFGDPNDLAQILCTAIPFAFCITRRRSFLSFLLGCAISTLLVWATITTRSRGGLVALGAVSIIMIGLLFPARMLPTVMSILIIGGLLACPMASVFMEESAHDRVVFWGAANWVFKRTPLFGIGYNMFAEKVVSDRAAHNAFVVCYTELGVFGYWFWFTLIVVGIMGAWRAKMALRKEKGVDAAWLSSFAGLSIAAIVGYMASAYFLSRTFVYPTLFLFALLGAIPVVAQRMLPKDHPPLVRHKKDVFILGTLGSLGSIMYIYLSIIFLNKAFFG